MPSELKSIKFFVDSQAALMALISPEIKSLTVANTIKELNHLGDLCGKIKLVWIKAHNGSTGNERADDLAKEGCSKTPCTETNIPFATIKSELKEYFYDKWKKEWEDYPLARQTKQFFAQPNEGKSKLIYNKSRREVGTLVRVITGHNTLNYHMSLMEPGHDHRCRFCEHHQETFAHFVTECPAFMTERVEILGARELDVEELKEISPDLILEFAKNHRVEQLLDSRENRPDSEEDETGIG